MPTIAEDGTVFSMAFTMALHCPRLDTFLEDLPSSPSARYVVEHHSLVAAFSLLLIVVALINDPHASPSAISSVQHEAFEPVMLVIARVS